MVIVFEGGPDMEWAVITSTALAIAAASIGTIQLVRTVLRPAHKDRMRVISAHWGKEANRAAWQHAHDSTGGVAAHVERQQQGIDVSKLSRGPLARAGGVLSWIGTAGLLIAGALVMLVTFARKPGGRWDAGEPNRTYSEDGEAGLAAISTSFTVTAVVAAVIFLLGQVVVTVARRAEWRDLSAASEAPDGARPPDGVLARHSRYSGGVGRMLCVLAGAGLCLGFVSVILVGNEVVPFAGYVQESVLVLAGSAALLVVGVAAEAWAFESGREIRNLIARRWPSLPSARESG